MKNGNISIEKIANETHATLTSGKANLLFELSKAIPQNGIILEVGSRRGGSAIIMAMGLKSVKQAKIYAIDPHTCKTKDSDGKEVFTLKIFTRNLRKFNVSNRVMPVIKTSYEASRSWRLPIYLLWIDGDHDYEFVKMDFLLWERHLVIGGTIAFHDSSNPKNHPGPARVVKEYILDSERFRNVRKIDQITYAEKVRKKNIQESLKDIFSLYKCELLTAPKRIDQKIGKFGIYLRKYYPKVYETLKRT